MSMFRDKRVPPTDYGLTQAAYAYLDIPYNASGKDF